MKIIRIAFISTLALFTVNTYALDILRSTNNQESCVISGLQNVNNMVAANSIFAECKRNFQPHAIVKPSFPLGKIGGANCIEKYGSKTTERTIALRIRQACVCINMDSSIPVPYLYGLFDDLMTPEQLAESRMRKYCENGGYL